MGCPQCSILGGPVLFVIYVIDLFNVSYMCFCTIVCTWYQCRWCRGNLSNLFTTMKNKRIKLSTNCPLMWKHQVYVIFPSIISNDIELNSEKTMSKGIGILHRAKYYLKYITLLAVHYISIYPYVIYFIEICGFINTRSLVSLLKSQKRTLCNIKSIPIRKDSAPLFLELGILLVFKMYMMKLAIVKFKSFLHWFSVESINELFTERKSVHNRDTRQA